MKISVVLLVVLATAVSSHPGESNEFLGVVQRYADTLIEHGRDTYGPQKSGLILSALDRMTLTPLTLRPTV